MYVCAFELWKEQMEKKTSSWFVRATGDKGTVDSTTTYYYCNRSGYFTSRGGQKRHLKAQGSSKLDTYCIASIVARTTQDGKSWRSTAQHTMDMQHF